VVAGAGDVFDDDLQLVDDEIRELLGAYLDGFAAFVSNAESRLIGGRHSRGGTAAGGERRSFVPGTSWPTCQECR